MNTLRAHDYTQQTHVPNTKALNRIFGAIVAGMMICFLITLALLTRTIAAARPQAVVTKLCGCGCGK